MNAAVLLAPFVLAGTMTEAEADAVAERMTGRRVPELPSAWLAMVRVTLENYRRERDADRPIRLGTFP